MGSTIYAISTMRDGVEMRGSIVIDDEDVRQPDTIIRAKMRQQPWYTNQPITILSTRRQDATITRATPDINQLHKSAYQAMSQAHALLAQHAQQGCPSCSGFQPSVRTVRDTMSQSGYASQSPTAKPVMGGVQLHPALLPGEGRNPVEADRDPVSGLGNGTGRATIAELGKLNCGEVERLLVPATSGRKRRG